MSHHNPLTKSPSHKRLLSTDSPRPPTPIPPKPRSLLHRASHALLRQTKPTKEKERDEHARETESSRSSQHRWTSASDPLYHVGGKSERQKETVGGVGGAGGKMNVLAWAKKGSSMKEERKPSTAGGMSNSNSGANLSNKATTIGQPFASFQPPPSDPISLPTLVEYTLPPPGNTNITAIILLPTTPVPTYLDLLALLHEVPSQQLFGCPHYIGGDLVVAAVLDDRRVLVGGSEELARVMRFLSWGGRGWLEVGWEDGRRGLDDGEEVKEDDAGYEVEREVELQDFV